ncbi:hypothetical protein ACA910_010785 [Epithemia clementina (nom. ined.)]
MTNLPDHNKLVVAALGCIFLPKLTLCLLPVSVGVLRRTPPYRHNIPSYATSRRPKHDYPGRVVDAEFETVPENTDDGKQRISKHAQNNDDYAPKSLLDLSLSSDPEIGNLRIPFCDGENCIDVRLSFMTDLDGVQYAIGIPYDYAAAITLERKNGDVVNLSPDLDENLEYMELMAQQLQETVGDDLRLVKTPRILTIAGPLNKYTENWKEELLPKSVDTKTLLNQDDEDVDSFLNFMKQELGEDEFAKTMNEEHSFDEETLSLFDIPGLGDNEDEFMDLFKKELVDISSSLEDDYAESQKRAMENVVEKSDLNHDGVALKLVSYGMADGKRYSLVHLLKPVVLVAQHLNSSSSSSDEHVGVENESAAAALLANPPRFELLSPEELRIVSPRLEEVCRKDLERLGWDFDEDE